VEGLRSAAVLERIAAPDATPDRVAGAVERDGYALVERLLDEGAVAEARADLRRVLDRTPLGRNEFEGHRTRRIYALFAKTRMMDGPATHPLVLGTLDRLLGPHYQFSAPVGIDIGPGEVAQPLHRDEQVHPVPSPHPNLVVNTMWSLDDFTAENGATLVLPGSHRWGDDLPDPLPTPVPATMPAGSVLFYPGNLVHGGGANVTDRPRLGVILEYVVAWLRPQENHCLAVPREVVAGLPERLQELLGYNIFPPFVGYVDGRHPRRVLASAPTGG
jgi:ectoine hydroxylase-related dioxygenase (phytanoyl-CoA dioxygenase family)